MCSTRSWNLFLPNFLLSPSNFHLFIVSHGMIKRQGFIIAHILYKDLSTYRELVLGVTHQPLLKKKILHEFQPCRIKENAAIESLHKCHAVPFVFLEVIRFTFRATCLCSTYCTPWIPKSYRGYGCPCHVSHPKAIFHNDTFGGLYKIQM